ncbi:FAD-dependent monooxygenase OpS4 like protein [Verticillium longisporum]|nr:FAD-dependent monooxygenase OpS4 like protein [Verticillium longisporum]
MPFRIIIVDAGIAGLCAAIGLAQQGHEVTILESAKELTPIGVGIHIPPNATLVLKHFGILERMTDDAIHPTKFVFRRWNDNKVIATAPAGKQQQGTPPYWSMRRSHYQRHLYDAMIEAGAKLRLNARVETVNEQEPSVASDCYPVGKLWASSRRELIARHDSITKRQRETYLQ